MRQRKASPPSFPFATLYSLHGFMTGLVDLRGQSLRFLLATLWPVVFLGKQADTHRVWLPSESIGDSANHGKDLQ